MDIIVSFILLLILLPVFVLLIILFSIANRGYPFYFQRRPGRKEQQFTLIKFKTMRDQQDSSGHLLPDAQRLTPLGGFVRSTSLDEIPQLLNVLKRDMSLVGPRPLLVKYLDRYTPEQRKRHLVRPGITGWAQVNGRNNISWDKKLQMDVWYVNHQGFILDLKILFKTVVKVIRRADVASEGQATTTEFKGIKK